MAHQVKVLLLGSGDSGKSTILKQMRLIHRVAFSAQEIEYYRQLVFSNITHGLFALLEAMQDMELEVAEEHRAHVALVEDAPDLKDGEPFPRAYQAPLLALWNDEGVKRAFERGNEAAIPEKCVRGARCPIRRAPLSDVVSLAASRTFTAI
jgi:guanine nucleotide-binding protein subunit alpha, other